MPFPRRLLNEDEEVVVDVRPHVWELGGPAAIVAVVIAGGVVVAVESPPVVIGWIVLAALVVALVNLLVRYLRWRTTSLVVTNQRLVRRSGVLAKRGTEIPLAQLSDVSYHQTLFERIIGAGDLTFESSGRSSPEVFAAVPRPAEVQNEIYGLIAAHRVGTPGGAGLSIPEQLEKLDELRRRGVLSEREFADAKARLLRAV